MKISDKPWGYEILFALTDKYAGKIIYVKEGHRLSLQKHAVKDETIWLHRGLAEVTVKGDTFKVSGNAMEFRIDPGVVHRIKALTDCEFIEVSTPELDDVIRLEDDYGRS
jgi:mannose-6-phosphate isomerase